MVALLDLTEERHHLLDTVVKQDFTKKYGTVANLDLDHAAGLLSTVVGSSVHSYRQLEPPRELDEYLQGIDLCKAFLSRHPLVLGETTSVLEVLQAAHESGDYAAVRRMGNLDKTTMPTSASFRKPNPGALPQMNEQQTNESINKYLDEIRSTMRVYIQGGRSLPTWSPTNVKNEVADHIRDLEIPVLQEPSLLLHGLGKMSKDAKTSARISSILALGKHIFVCNASGSGKTRLLLEALCCAWGLYFVCQVDSNGIGSRDLTDLITEELSQSVGWNQSLPPPDDPNFDIALESNEAIARRLLRRVLLARLLIFRLFLETCQCQSGGFTSQHKQRWLLLQVAPTILFRPHGDIFQCLSQGPLRGSDEQCVSDLIASTFRDIAKWLGEQLPLGKLFCFIDEAQVAADSHPYAFMSATRAENRPVLKEIVKVWSKLGALHFVVAGTGVSVSIVNDSLGSPLGKPESFRRFHDTGAFNDDQSHKAYFQQYLPPDFLETEAGKALLQRSWHWLHGRYRYTASYVMFVLENGWRSPHRLLDQYVFRYTNYYPSDGARKLRDEEDTLTSDCMLSIIALGVTFNSEKLVKHPSLINQACSIVFRYLSRRQMRLVSDEKMVEVGFARFLHDSARVDELLSVLCMARWLDTQKGFTFKAYLSDRMKIELRWQAFEDIIALYMCRAFHPEVPLTDIFHFFETTPDWAHKGAELVTFTRDENGGHIWAPVNLISQQPTTPGGPFGIDCSSWTCVLNWLNDQGNIPICFPSNRMGPDIFFLLRLVDGQFLWVAVQTKCYATRINLNQAVLTHAIKSVTPSSYYRSIDRPNREKVMQAIKQLPNSLATGGKFPVLRVIVAPPSTAATITIDPTQDKHPLAALRMDEVMKMVELGILATLGKQLQQRGVKHTLDDLDEEEAEADDDSPEEDASQTDEAEGSPAKRVRRS